MILNLDMFSLQGKVALVTGANTGLGQGICCAYAAAGASEGRVKNLSASHF